MITAIRNYFSGKATKALMFFAAFALFLPTVLPSMMRKFGGGTWVFRVNNQEIDYANYNRSIRAQDSKIQQLRAQLGNYAEMYFAQFGQDINPKNLAREHLIRTELIKQVADEIGLYLSDEYIGQQLRNKNVIQRELAEIIPAGVIGQNGSFDQDILYRYLRSIEMSVADFDAAIYDRLRQTLVVNLTVAGAHIPDFILKERYIQELLPKSFDVLTISGDAVLAEVKKGSLTDDELKNFYTVQSKKYMVGEKRQANLWRFNPETYSIVINNEDIKEYYERRKRERYIDQTAQVQIRKIVLNIKDESNKEAVYKRAVELKEELLKDPASFANQAKKLSDDKETASKGGLTDYFSRGKESKIVENTAFLLTKDGEISDVIQTVDQYVIIQRVGRKEATYKSFASVEQEIKAILARQWFNDHFMRDLKTILADGVAQDDELKQFIQDHNGKNEQKDSITRDSTRLGQAVFSLKENGYTFFIEDGVGTIVQLTGIQKSYVPTFEDIKSIVQDDVYRDKADKLLMKKIKQAQQLALKKVSFADIKKEVGGSIETTEMVKKSDNKVLDILSKKGLPVYQMIMLTKIGSIVTSIEQNQGVIARLAAIGAFDDAEFQKERQALSRAIQETVLQRTIEGFVASLYKNATIEKNEQLLGN